MRLVYAVLATFVLMATGCSSKPNKNDFAGFSFEASRPDLESQGFICKDGEKGAKYVCVNLDWAGSMFGRQVKGVTIKVGEKDELSSITIGIDPPPAKLPEALALSSSIDALYEGIKKDDVTVPEVFERRWRRPDKSVVKLLIFTGVPGVIPVQATFTAYNHE